MFVFYNNSHLPESSMEGAESSLLAAERRKPTIQFQLADGSIGFHHSFGAREKANRGLCVLSLAGK